jgi:hypothetical protein
MLKQTLSGIAIFLLAAAAAAQPGQFVDAPQFATGMNPQAVAYGDFNGDGKLDLAVVNSTANTVSVMLGNGDGTFKAKVDYPTGTAPQGVAVGDFYNDGKLDLAVTNSGSTPTPTVSLLRGNGDGSFQPKVDFATGVKPWGVAVGDFNKDGNLDLVVTNAHDGTVSILLGNGHGGFAAHADHFTGFNPVSVAVVDLNQDGNLDLAVACNVNTNTVSVLLGKGDGTFQNQLQFTAASNPISIVAADFNHDGFPDLAVADQEGDSVSIFISNGKTGSAWNLAGQVPYDTAAFPTGVTVADFNGDGNIDLAVTNGDGNSVSVLLGNGDGTFLPQTGFGAGNIPFAVVAADFNGDGNTDLIAANSGSNSISVILGNGNGTFQTRIDYEAGANPYSVATGDFNGDGIADLAIAASNCATSPCGQGAVTVMLGRGDGSFRPPVQYSTGTTTDPRAVAVGSFVKGSNVLDLVVANYSTGTVSIFLGNGNGTFDGHVDYPVGSEPASLAVGDFNGDGNLDVVAANFNGDTVSLLLGNGDGTFKPQTTFPVGHGPISVAVSDFNGDKKLDLVVVNETDNSVSILLGNGNGGFSNQVSYPTGTGGNPLDVVVGDFNGDGSADLAVADYTTQRVSILLGKGDGTFQPVTAYPTGANPSSIVAADFNGDGKMDLALTSTPLGVSSGNLVSLLLGNGDGTFGVPALFSAGDQAYSAVVGDFNGDGAPDLAVANGNSNTVSILLNSQGSLMTLTSSSNPSSYGQTVTFTASVTASVAGSGTPTGTVTLQSGSTVIGSGPLSGNSFAAGTSVLPEGSDTVSATYSGNSTFQPHTVSIMQVVNKVGTGTTLSASNTGNPNVPVNFTATVSSNTAGTPTGSVSLFDGATLLGTTALAGNTAAFSVSLAVGSHSITATYSGDANFATSTSPVLNVVQKAETATALLVTNTGNATLPVTFSATVTSTSPGSPTGSVNFFDGATLVGNGAISAGTATLSATLSAGTHNITATYSGDANFNVSTSAVFNVFQKGGTATVLTASPNPGNPNQTITLTATINSSSSGTPTGNVVFMDGTTSLGSAAVSATSTAVMTVPTLTIGTHSLTAAYSGDSNFVPSTSAILSEVINTQDFSLATTQSSMTLTPPASGSTTITTSPINGFNVTGVTLTCAVTPAVSQPATCAIGTMTIANGTGTSTLTINTVGPQSALQHAADARHSSGGLYALGLIVPAMLLGSAGMGKQNRRKLLGICIVFLVLSGAMVQVACSSGGSSNNGGGGTGTPGTPAGQYTVTITGTASGGLQHTATVNLTVQ